MTRGSLAEKQLLQQLITRRTFRSPFPTEAILFLNRNTRLSYRDNFGRHGRNVTLSGEAFFEITRDEKNPFIVDAGNASVKVIGTSFNVITKNSDSAVEVFVKTGQVLSYR